MTGAPVPLWAESIVMIEDLTLNDDGTVIINRLPESGAWIRPKGSDIAETSVSSQARAPDHS